MGRARLIALALALAAQPGAEAAPAEPPVLAPAGPWNLDAAEDRCRLARVFGEEGNQHLLAFEQWYPGTAAAMFVAGPLLKGFASGGRTELRLFDGQAPLVSSPFKGEVEAFGPAVIYRALRLDEPSPSTEVTEDPEAGGIPRLGPPPRAARVLDVRQGGTGVTLATGPFVAALAALNRCSEDLIRSWGLDVEQHRTATRRVVLVNAKDVSNAVADRFPRDLARSETQAIVRLRVIVGADGKGEDCRVLGMASAAKAPPPVCQAMARAVFEPARDAQGKPMRSYYATTVTYEVWPSR